MMYARGWEFPAFFFWQNETLAKIVYSILSFYSTEIDIQAVINQVCFFALGKGRTDRYK